MDLDKMSRDELLTLKREVDQLLTTLDDRRRAEARAAAEKVVKDYGYSLEEVATKSPKGKAKSPAKFRNPEDPKQTWTGKGRQPKWIKSGLEEGKSLDEFAI